MKRTIENQLWIKKTNLNIKTTTWNIIKNKQTITVHVCVHTVDTLQSNVMFYILYREYKHEIPPIEQIVKTDGIVSVSGADDDDDIPLPAAAAASGSNVQLTWSPIKMESMERLDKT